MHNATTLNELYTCFATGLLDKKDIEGYVFRVLNENSSLLPDWNADDYSDYISWLYPRISRAIDSYRETGSNFEAYICSIVRLTAKEYRYNQLRNNTAETTAWMTQVPDMYTGDPEPEYPEDKPAVAEKLLPIPKDNAAEKDALQACDQCSCPRQLLILALKCCSYISDDFAKRISSRLGIAPEALTEMFSRLKRLRLKRLQKIDQLREKANNQFCRCLYYEQTLRSLSKECSFYPRVKERSERARDRLENTRMRLAQLRPDPSNQQIADILGVSKGTVDSSLHRLKKRGALLDNCLNENVMN